MTRTNDRFIRQRKDFLEIVFQRLVIGNVPTTHGAREKRIAHDRDRARETGHHIGHSAARVTPGQSGIDLQIAKLETFPLLDCFCAGNWFSCWGKNVRAGFFSQARQIRDMIGVRVRKENKSHAQFVVVRKAYHFAAIGPRIKSCRRTTCWVPDEICVNGHIVIMAVELSEAVHLINFFGVPFALGKFTKCSRGETQNRRNAQKRQLIEIALSQLTDFLRADPRFFCQFAIGNAQAALRFADDIPDVVFERNHSPSSNVYRLRLLQRYTVTRSSRGRRWS